tara:strand:+ start:4964 stop:5485 length:522 start_codon:yes stop_codon:yes gene_type:complete
MGAAVKVVFEYHQIDVVIFDFDGVLTDNRVIIDQSGQESVVCNRADGLAFDVLRAVGLPTYIVSTETVPLAQVRGRKLQVPVLLGVKNKLEALHKLTTENDFSLKKTLYAGNDLNDYYAMKECGIRVCPADSHAEIKAISDVVLEARGGEGVAREIIEVVLGINIAETLYKNE